MMWLGGHPPALPWTGSTAGEVIAMRGWCSPAVRPVAVRTLVLGLVWLLLTSGCGGPAGEPAAEPQPEPAPVTVEVQVFFANEGLGDPCGEVFAVARTVDADDPVVGTLQALLAGPTAAEQAAGYGGWFSSDTADALLDVVVAENGTVHVTFSDLRQLIPDASSSCGSAGLLAQLDTTLTALDGITATRYALADQIAFYTWLQLDDPDAPLPDEEPVEPAPDVAAPNGPAEPPEGSGAGPLTVERIAAALERELETETRHFREATVICDASGAARAGDVFVCSVDTVPPEPTGDWGRYVVAVLDEDTIVRGYATDHPLTTAEVRQEYAAATRGLYCRDLRHGWPPRASGEQGADEGFLFSVVYWNLEGQPARMDADGDGIPCETLYEPTVIEALLLDIP
jgi:hypothetical protein